MNLSRRRFLAQAATLAAGSTFRLPGRAAEKHATGKIRSGLIADIHQDIMHDALERLGHFLEEAATRKADAIVDLGDFCIPYLHINSASYYWLGDKNRRERYDAAIHQAHPFIACTAPYRDALFTFLEIDLDARTFALSSARSEWVGPSPQEMNAMYPGIENDWVVPACSARDGKLAG